MGNEALVTEVGDSLCHSMPVHFLAFVNFVPPRVAARMVMTGEGIGLFDVADEVAFHDLHVVDVVQKLDLRGIHLLHQVHTPGGMIRHVVLVVDLAVEEFQVHHNLLFFGVRLDPVQPGEAVSQPLTVGHTLAVTRKDDDVGHSGSSSQSNVPFQTLQYGVVVFQSVEADRNRVGRRTRGHGRYQTVFFHGGVLVRSYQIDTLEADSDGFLAQCVQIKPLLISPQ